jgi:hypothetical protein
VRTRFDIDHATSGVTVNAQEMRTGLRLGGGLEIGLGERVRLRLRLRLRPAYSVTDYGDYELAYGFSADRFEHREGLASGGLAWPGDYECRVTNREKVKIPITIDTNQGMFTSKLKS